MKIVQHNRLKPVVAICILLVFYLTACREKYVPQLLNDPPAGYLVVDGFINSGTGPTTISLSRSTKISVSSAIVRETKATVRVVGKVNTVGFALTEISPGVYQHPQLTLNAAEQYRLYIKTTGGKEYFSDYSDVRFTPDIDSVSWRVERAGVQIYANTHGQTNPGYYQFKFEDTWEFVSTYQSFIKIYNDRDGKAHHIGYIDSSTYSYDNTIYRCWRTETPGNILVYSTEKLTQNIVPLYPLLFIEPGSWKLAIRYSILVKSYAWSRENFRFLEQLKKNTEQLGSIFDAQPSETLGNIHNTADATEPVIGFIEVGEEKQKRIFITNAQVPFWYYNNYCDPEYPVANIATDLENVSGLGTNVFKYTPLGGIDSGNFVSRNCVDCTLRGSNKNRHSGNQII